ncbi:MAG: insulinase family protein [Polyangiaceae bacterium]|nr:insulinase family protein [Polyangiaceae bacterium]
MHPPAPAWLAELNAAATHWGQVERLPPVAFGPALEVERYRLANGLEVALIEDHSAPVVAYHTWFRVGSRHERPGKTGIAHLFEHLMFRETETLPEGEFDRRLEEIGAENNASTWLDWTSYTINVPAESLPLVVGLESERMSRLVLSPEIVASEKEVVANERRYRVEDDVEGTANEVLWSTAFTCHGYGIPTIGWMADIEGFTAEDCRAFYRTYYAPNDAIVVAAGDVTPRALVELVSRAYGGLPPAELPIEDVHPEPPQTDVRTRELRRPTPTEKISVGWHGPAMGDFDHPAVSLLAEVLTGGRASRLHARLVRELEIATDVRVFVGPFRDPSLIEVSVAARPGHTAEELVDALDRELERVRAEPVLPDELERGRARLELALLSGLETAEGKASTVGFYETVLRRPAGAFERLEALAALGPSDLLRVARRYLRADARTVVIVRPEGTPGDATTGDGEAAA